MLFYLLCVSLRFDLPLGGCMALPDLEDHLAENGVDPALSSHLISGGWNSQNFAAVVDSKAGFTDDIWAELSDQPIPLVQRANLKVA